MNYLKRIHPIKKKLLLIIFLNVTNYNFFKMKNDANYFFCRYKIEQLHNLSSFMGCKLPKLVFRCSIYYILRLRSYFKTWDNNYYTQIKIQGVRFRGIKIHLSRLGTTLY